MKYYTPASLSRLGVLPFKDRQTIIKMIHRGEIRAQKSGGQKNGIRYIVSEEALREYLEKIK